MATDTDAKSVHNTLSGTTADTVTVTPAATADISARTGTLANALPVTCDVPDPTLLGAAAKWDRVLTADELASLPTLMAA